MYLLIAVARGYSKHVGLLSKQFCPVPLTGLHAVFEVVLIIRVKGLDEGNEEMLRMPFNV
jgi:hypothetical protein